MIPPTISVVVNQSYDGGFNLSAAAVTWMIENGCDVAKLDRESGDDLLFACHFRDHKQRHDPWLIRAVESLGPMASAGKSKLVVVTVYGRSYQIFSDGNAEIVFGEFFEIPKSVSSKTPTQTSS